MLPSAHSRTAQANATPPPPSRSYPTSNGPSHRYTASKSASKHSLYDLSTSNISEEHLRGLRRQSNFSTLSLSPRRPSSLAPSGSTATTRPRRGTPLAFTRQDADESGFLGQSEVEEDAPWTIVDRMRNWRNDAMTQHLYDSAKFWGGKVLGMTGSSFLPCFLFLDDSPHFPLLIRRQPRRRFLARPDPLPHSPVLAS
jgi:anaphase-promoting complex subunit 6